MGEYKVAFSPHSDRDLERIVRYIRRDNPEAANRLGQKMVDRAFSLARQETALIGSRLLRRPEIRKLIEGNYVIFYRVYPEQRKVRILRFWHSAQSPRRLRYGT